MSNYDPTKDPEFLSLFGMRLPEVAKAQAVKDQEKYALSKEQEVMIADADKSRGGNALDRLATGFRGKPEDEFSYLKSKLGQENVKPLTDNDGQIENFLVRNNPYEKFTVFDPDMKYSGIWNAIKDSPKELLDVAGTATEAIPSAIGGASGAILGAGTPASIPLSIGLETLGAAAGSGIRQGVSALLPGEETITPKERLINAGVNVVGSLVGSGAQVGASKLIGKFGAKGRLSNALVKRSAKELEEGAIDYSSVIARRKALSEKTGIDFTAGQMSGSREALIFEKAASQAPKTEGLMLEHRALQNEQYQSFLNKTIDAMGGDNVSSLEAAQRISNARESIEDSLRATRRQNAKINFGKVDQLAGNKPVISLKNTLDSIDEMAESLRAPLGNDATTSELDGLERIKSKLIKRYDPDEKLGNNILVPAGNFQRSLEIYGKKSLKAIKDIDDAANYRVTKTIFDSLRKDLVAASEKAESKPIADALIKARNTYAADSRPLEEIETTLLEKAVDLVKGEGGQKLGDAIISSASTPQQIEKAMLILRQADPEAALQFRKIGLQSILDNAWTTGQNDLVSEGASVSSAKLTTRLSNPKVKARIAALFVGESDKFKQFSDVLEVSKILSNTAKTGESPTAALLWHSDPAYKKIISKVPLFGEQLAAISERIVGLSPKQKVDLMIHPESRDLLLKIAKPKPSNARVFGQEAIRNVSEMLNILRRDYSIEPLPQSIDNQQSTSERLAEGY